MASLESASVVRQISSLFEGSSVAGLSDRQLLDRFVSDPDSAREAAFAALVSRHGSLVLAVCVDVLSNQHDAEDAFQAVFLILAQKARSIREPDLLANWLYGVALRTARHAKHRRPLPSQNREGEHHDERHLEHEDLVYRAVGPGPGTGRGFCTKRSSACHASSGCRLFCATSRALVSTKRPAVCAGPTERSAAGWPAPLRQSSAAGLARRGVALTRHCIGRGTFRSGQPRPRSLLPTCAETTARLACDLVRGRPPRRAPWRRRLGSGRIAIHVVPQVEG